MENFYLFGFIQALFFVVLILTKKNKILSDYFLAVFILLLGGQLLFIYSYSSGLFQSNPWFIIVDIYYWTLLGPALLVYTKLMVNGKNKLDWKYAYFLIPTVLVTLAYAKYIFSDGTYFFSELADQNRFLNIVTFIWMYNSPVFYIFTIIELVKHKKNIKHHFSYTKSVDLKWLFFLSNSFAFFLFLLLFSSKIRFIFNINIPYSVEYVWLVMSIYIFCIGYYGLKQKGIFLDNDMESYIDPTSETLPESISSQIDDLGSSYQKSKLNESDAKLIAQNLMSLMESEKPYLDCELKLITLSKKLSTTTHKLSQVLNIYMEKTFFDFINEYRINDVKEQLLHPETENQKIISVAYDCGFNSKSTFYTLFKKTTSLTPIEFRKQYSN